MTTVVIDRVDKRVYVDTQVTTDIVGRNEGGLMGPKLKLVPKEKDYKFNGKRVLAYVSVGELTPGSLKLLELLLTDPENKLPEHCNLPLETTFMLILEGEEILKVTFERGENDRLLAEIFYMFGIDVIVVGSGMTIVRAILALGWGAKEAFAKALKHEVNSSFPANVLDYGKEELVIEEFLNEEEFLLKCS